LAAPAGADPNEPNSDAHSPLLRRATRGPMTRVTGSLNANGCGPAGALLGAAPTDRSDRAGSSELIRATAAMAPGSGVVASNE
jgi:hypothetical protein